MDDTSNLARHRHRACLLVVFVGIVRLGRTARRQRRPSTTRRAPAVRRQDGTDAMSDFATTAGRSIDRRRWRNIACACGCCGGRAARSRREPMAGRQHHRPRLGRGPARDEQPAAALVDVAVRASPSSSRSATSCSIPGLGSCRGTLGLDARAASYEAESRRPTRTLEAALRAYAACRRRASWRSDARRDGDRRATCSSTTAPRATARTRAAAGLSRT